VHAARLTLGLDDVKPFAPQELVVEERVAPRLAGLRAKSLVDFADELARATPAPGGGSVAAYLGALGTGLTTMVAALTHPGAPEEERGRLEELGARAEALRERLLRAVDDDTAAFEAMVSARRMKKKTPEEQAAREEAMLAATRQGIAVPMSVLEAAAEAAGLAAQVAAVGLEAAASDCGVSAWCARAAGSRERAAGRTRSARERGAHARGRARRLRNEKRERLRRPRRRAARAGGRSPRRSRGPASRRPR
jgi:glutamate formiminotransferase/formiminotetrahydrofolate cyclodeaminase